MKKFLLSLVALLGVMNANAQVTETDLTAYEDVIYAQPTTVLLSDVSKVLALPINMKSHTSVTGTDFFISVPEGAEITGTKGLSTDRYIEDATHQVQIAIWAGNYLTNDENPDKTKYHVVSTIVSSNGKASTADDYETYGFEPGDGELGYLYLDISNLGVGEYPLIITSQDISGFFDGTPDAKITEQIVTKLIITNTIILDENSTTAPDMAENVDVLVKRTIKADTWSTICLPFAMSEAQVKEAFGDGAQLADFTGFKVTSRDDDNLIMAITVNFASASSIQANHPYLIKATKDVTYDEGFKVENVSIAPAKTPQVGMDWDEDNEVYSTFFKGVWIPTTLTNNTYLFLSDNKFYYAKKDVSKVKGFRGYFKLKNSVNSAYRDITSSTGVKMQVNVDGEPTGVNGLQIVNAAEGVFTIDGKKMNNDVTKLPKGVYIIDGKKVAIK